MKRYIYNLFMLLLATVAMTSCTAEEGTEPGNDSNPAVRIYQYKASRPNNPDNDIILRFSTNNKVSEVYYLIEKQADKDSHVSSMGKDGYMDHVISKGTKLDNVSDASSIDVTVTDLYGDFAITAVAVGKGKKASSESLFSGLEWSDVATGTYYFSTQAVSGTASSQVSGIASTPTVLQVCTTDANLYRFKDVFGMGYHMKINLIDIKNSDADGEYQFFRVPATETSFIFGQHGAVGIRDIGYWQGNDAFVTENGYESGMYGNYNCFVFIQYYVTAGNIGYGYDNFIAD